MTVRHSSAPVKGQVVGFQGGSIVAAHRQRMRDAIAGLTVKGWLEPTGGISGLFAPLPCQAAAVDIAGVACPASDLDSRGRGSGKRAQQDQGCA